MRISAMISLLEDVLDKQGDLDIKLGASTGFKTVTGIWVRNVRRSEIPSIVLSHGEGGGGNA